MSLDNILNIFVKRNNYGVPFYYITKKARYLLTSAELTEKMGHYKQ